MDPQASGSEIEDLTKLTLRQAVEITHLLAVAEPRATALFDSVTVIAVDNLYNAWYVGAVPASENPISETLSEDTWVELEGEFDAGYQRAEEVLKTDPSDIPEEGCA